jgi:hypothetical protein
LLPGFVLAHRLDTVDTVTEALAGRPNAGLPRSTVSGGAVLLPTDSSRQRDPGRPWNCAVSAPPQRWGEAVTAVVELNPSMHATVEALIALCRHTLGGIRTPKRVEFIDSLPKPHRQSRQTRNPPPLLVEPRRSV